MSTFTNRFLLALLVMGAAACTVKDVDPPPLAGPSELGLRIALQMVPDTILSGGSQTVLNIEVTGADGRPVRGLPLTVEICEGGSCFDFGTLSAKTVVTGDDGRARVIYTAPPVNVDTVVTLIVTPVGNDFRGVIPRSIDIRIMPVGVILPPNFLPTAKFSVTPASPRVMETVTFDASASGDGPPIDDQGNQAPCGAACTYAWDFGDGSTGTGIFATHQYRSAGNYLVRLTVTDAAGASATAARTVTVAAGQPPTASFTFSPTNPAINQTVFFSASASTAAPGRVVVSYEWNFGDGARGSGVTTSHAYSAPGTYIVTLLVTDDAGVTDDATQNVTIGAPGTGPIAALTVSPTSGTTATNFFFDASASRAGPSPIVEYRFTFADGTPDVVGSSPTTTHRYATPGSYTTRVTVRDSAGRTATATQNVSVQ